MIIMNKRVKVLIATLCLCITICLTAMAQERGWRGLVPLHSTKADVERILGQPNEMLSPYTAFYRTANETVIVDYATGFPCGIGEKYSQWRVSKDTLEGILVTPFKGFPVSQLISDENKFEKRSGGHRPEDIYYINDQDGESIRVFRGEVMDITFYPGRVDAGLSCSQLQRVSSKPCEGLTPPASYSYVEVMPERGKSHLDSFAIVLQRERSKIGYIIAYAGKRATVGEAKERAERAKNYLVKVRGLSSLQLKTIDGGYREAPTIELYAVETDGCTPIPNPTVDPRDIQIIKKENAGNKSRSL
jgi:hypothetical protein